MKRAVLLLALLAPNLAQAQDLARAMDDEIAQLQTEKRALRRALEKAEKNARRTRALATKQIEEQTAELSRTRAENVMRSQRLPDAERAHSLEDQARQMAQLTDQIRAWRATKSIQTTSEMPIDTLVTGAFEYLQRSNGLRIEEAEYFGTEGTARRAPILFVAQVAAIVQGPGLPLVLAPDGSLRATRGVEPGAGRVTGGEVVNAVLFDPLEAHTPESYHEEGIADWLRRGGLLMWPLVLLGLIGLLLTIERAFALSMASARVSKFVRAPHDGAKNDPLLRAAVLVMNENKTAAQRESDAAEALVRARPALRRGVSFLGIVAAVAPLIGLLGTVTGMIRTFAIITDHGTGDPRLLSAGISEALLTTQLGLMVAVPALLLHTGLLRWGHTILARVERIAIARLEDS